MLLFTDKVSWCWKMAELDILRLSSTAAAQRTQQLFQEMEADESIFRNAVIAAEAVIEDLKKEETAVSQRRAAQSKYRADSLRMLTGQEVQFLENRERQRMEDLNSTVNGNYVIRDPKQWAFPNIRRNISKDYLWMLDLATR